jgi:4'-phosphopantetheinyl transferase
METYCTWPVAPESKLSLSRNEVHVWRVSLAPPAGVYQNLYNLLSDDERRRAEQFKFDNLKKRFVAARGALRDILSRYLKAAASQIEFEYDSHGKPQLAAAHSRDGIGFNLSHAENLALCAVTRGRAIGVDVEFVRPLADAEKIAKRFFSPLESSVFSALPEEKRTIAFFNCWTRKEAFIKAIGAGLSYPLHRFDVSFVAGEPAALLSTRPNPQEALKWKLHALSPAPDYVGAFAVDGDDFKLSCWQWEAPMKSI